MSDTKPQRKPRPLKDDAVTVLYQLCDWVEKHGDVWAMLNHAHDKPVQALLRRGYVIVATFENGGKGARLTQSGYDEGNRLWDADPDNPERIEVGK